MRILGISPNFNQNRNVNFGWFRDDNARRIVKEALTTKAPDYFQFCSDTCFERVESCDYFEAYTSDDGTVKGKFDDEFERNANKKITRRIENLKRRGVLEDLSQFDNAEEVSSELEDMDNILKGVDLAAKLAERQSSSSSEPAENYASTRAEEEAYR